MTFQKKIIIQALLLLSSATYAQDRIIGTGTVTQANIKKRIADKLFNREISARRLRDELLSMLKTMLEVTKA